jgi:hypothetical protein
MVLLLAVLQLRPRPDAMFDAIGPPTISYAHFINMAIVHQSLSNTCNYAARSNAVQSHDIDQLHVIQMQRQSYPTEDGDTRHNNALYHCKKSVNRFLIRMTFWLGYQEPLDLALFEVLHTVAILTTKIAGW